MIFRVFLVAVLLIVCTSVSYAAKTCPNGCIVELSGFSVSVPAVTCSDVGWRIAGLARQSAAAGQVDWSHSACIGDWFGNPESAGVSIYSPTINDGFTYMVVRIHGFYESDHIPTYSTNDLIVIACAWISLLLGWGVGVKS